MTVRRREREPEHRARTHRPERIKPWSPQARQPRDGERVSGSHDSTVHCGCGDSSEIASTRSRSGLAKCIADTHTFPSRPGCDTMAPHRGMSGMPEYFSLRRRSGPQDSHMSVWPSPRSRSGWSIMSRGRPATHRAKRRRPGAGANPGRASGSSGPARNGPPVVR